MLRLLYSNKYCISPTFSGGFSSTATLQNGQIEARIGQEIGTDGPHVLRTRLECEATSLWSQVIGQDSSSTTGGTATRISSGSGRYRSQPFLRLKRHLYYSQGPRIPPRATSQTTLEKPIEGGLRTSTTTLLILSLRVLPSSLY